jgi:AraC-like DNA-binding protein
MIPDHLMHTDPLIERFEQWARHRLTQGFSLGGAARATGTSERTLARRLKTVLGKTPLSYFQDLRVERAVHLLRTSSDSIDLIAAQVGYAKTTLRTSSAVSWSLGEVARRQLIRRLFAWFKIVSGGQTRVDRAALDWAIAKGIPHGGWCPQGSRRRRDP